MTMQFSLIKPVCMCIFTWIYHKLWFRNYLELAVNLYQKYTRALINMIVIIIWQNKCLNKNVFKSESVISKQCSHVLAFFHHKTAAIYITIKSWYSFVLQQGSLRKKRNLSMNAQNAKRDSPRPVCPSVLYMATLLCHIQQYLTQNDFLIRCTWLCRVT